MKFYMVMNFDVGVFHIRVVWPHGDTKAKKLIIRVG